MQLDLHLFLDDKRGQEELRGSCLLDVCYFPQI